MSPKLHRLERAVTGLLVVDIQERLLPQVFEKERLIRESVRLIRGATLLKIPFPAQWDPKLGIHVT